MIRTSRDGYACARAVRGPAASAAAPVARCKNCLRWGSFMASPGGPAGAAYHAIALPAAPVRPADRAAAPTLIKLDSRSTRPASSAVKGNGADGVRRGVRAMRERTEVPSRRTAIEVAGSDAQCEQFNRADTDHEHCERDGIVVEPMPLGLHDTPPGSQPISRTGRQMVQMRRT